MITIYKYRIPLQGKSSLPMPEGAEILSFQDQGGTLCIWAKVDTDRKLVDRYFGVAGTGFDLATIADWEYVGTSQQPGLVWHLFEDTTRKV